MKVEQFKKGSIWQMAKALAKLLGIRNGFNSWYKCRHVKRGDRDFHIWRRDIDYSKLSSQITAVILTMKKSHMFEECITSVKAQTLLPVAIEVVKDIMPFSRASQNALDLVRTPFYISVDDDMILYPSCFERLYFTITSNKNCAESLAMLNDPFMGKIKGVRMYKTEVVRKIGFYPLKDEKGCERNMTIMLKNSGYCSVNSMIVEGDHHPQYLPHEVFYKFKLVSEKSRYYQNKESPCFEDMMDCIMTHWHKTRSKISLYAMAGLFAGLQSDKIDRELNYKDRDNDPAFQKVKAFLDVL